MKAKTSAEAGGPSPCGRGRRKFHPREDVPKTHATLGLQTQLLAVGRAGVWALYQLYPLGGSAANNRNPQWKEQNQ